MRWSRKAYLFNWMEPVVQRRSTEPWYGRPRLAWPDKILLLVLACGLAVYIYQTGYVHGLEYGLKKVEELETTPNEPRSKHDPDQWRRSHAE